MSLFQPGRKIVAGLLVLSGVCLPMACQQKETAPPKPEVLIAVASSARDVVEQLAKEFQQDTSLEIQITSGSSASLARQIQAKAPVNLFLSAHEEWGVALQKDGLVDRSVKLLTNQLVLVVPKGNPAGVHKLEDILNPAVKRLALAGESVPAGVYAGEALKKLGLMNDLLTQKKIVRGQDVRQAAVFVERGEAEAGIVYSTDAAASSQVEVVARIPADLHEPIIYSLIVLKEGAEKPGTRRFFEFLQSQRALATFQSRGFVILDSR